MKDDANFGSVRSFGFRAPRISTNFSFFLEVPATGERYDAVCTDLSEDGLAAELPRPIPPGTQVVMRMLLPGGTQPILIKGKVEYGQSQGEGQGRNQGKDQGKVQRAGVTFSYSSPDEREQIQSFLRSMS